MKTTVQDKQFKFIGNSLLGSRLDAPPKKEETDRMNDLECQLQLRHWNRRSIFHLFSESFA